MRFLAGSRAFARSPVCGERSDIQLIRQFNDLCSHRRKVTIGQLNILKTEGIIFILT
ncbi:hypothetical protein GPP08_004602 [Salmonella enterica]|nr:hypothetical protein [Salmonella enterica]EGI5826832.1 hypothetical protein [Salmonella enterica subsp. enterica serovar Urbana]